MSSTGRRNDGTETAVTVNNFASENDQSEAFPVGYEMTSPVGDRSKDASRGASRIQKPPGITFGVTEVPPFYISLIYSVQVIFNMLGGTMGMVYAVHGQICGSGNNLLFAELLSTSIFACGVATLLQCALGLRLPIVQGGSHVFLAPIMAMMTTEKWRCPPAPSVNATANSLTMVEGEEPWRIRLLEISGSLAVASLTQVLFGMTGLIGFLMNYIGPLTIAPTVALIGLSLFELISGASEGNWGIAVLTVALMILFGLIMGGIQIPMPVWNRKRGCQLKRYPFFRIFANNLAIGVAWLLCYILTISDVFPDDPQSLGYKARTDAKLDAITKSKWIFIPYPGHWGLPTVGSGIFVGMLMATFASIIESVGDYYATARACGVPTPPPSAINRAVAMEGFTSIISGVLEAGHATTSFSQFIGFIGYTGVASLVTYEMAGVVLVIAGVFGKIGGALALVPDPIIGAMLTFAFGMVISVALSCLKYADMSSSRNQVILGLALMWGLSVPVYMRQHPGLINTGNEELDQVLTVFLSTSPAIGGLLGFVLDNIIPGTKSERGIKSTRELAAVDNTMTSEEYERALRKTYALPFTCGFCTSVRVCRYLPFMPCYDPDVYRCRWRCCKKREDELDDIIIETTKC